MVRHTYLLYVHYRGTCKTKHALCCRFSGKLSGWRCYLLISRLCFQVFNYLEYDEKQMFAEHDPCESANEANEEELFSNGEAPYVELLEGEEETTH